MRFPGFNDEWKETTIDMLAKVIGGGTPDTSVSTYWNGDIQWFTPSEVGKSKYVNFSLRKITEEGLKNSSAKLLPPFTILLSSRATVGECSLALQECTTNQGFQSLIAHGCDTEFLYYLIQTKKKDLLRKSCGSTFLEISSSEIRKIKTNLPTENEQRKITNLLSLIDKRIATQNKIIDNLQSLIKGLNDKFHQNEQGEAVSFSEIGTAYAGLSGKSGEDFGQGNPFITYLNVYQNNVVNDNDYGLVSIDANERQHTISYGDVLFTLSSETPEEVGIGSVYLGESDKFYLNSFCFGVTITQKDKVHPPYLAYLVSSTKFRRFVYPLAQGSTRFNLQKNDFMRKKLILPHIEEQRKIANALNAINKQLSNEQQLKELYNVQKEYLLRHLFI